MDTLLDASKPLDVNALDQVVAGFFEGRMEVRITIVVVVVCELTYKVVVGGIVTLLGVLSGATVFAFFVRSCVVAIPLGALVFITHF